MDRFDSDMDIEEARRIWGDAMNDEQLKGWLALQKRVRPENHDPSIPKGCTIPIDTSDLNGKNVS